VLAVVMAVAVASVLLYIDQRNSLHRTYVAGDKAAVNKIVLAVTVKLVDPANDDLMLSVLPTPEGNLVRPQDDTPTKGFVVKLGTSDPPLLTFPARKPIAVQTVHASLENSGTFTDYPFDAYSGAIGFIALAGDKPLPLVVSLRDIDPYFVTKAPASVTEGHVVAFQIRISRSRGTLILVWFIMVAMWALSLSVLGGAWILVSRRKGMIWPAFGWMAATLFALISVRNAAPGSPPIGSLIDYAAFFWSEGIIAASLAVAVVFGIRVERANAETATRTRPPA
jgi:Domain of unknown function (DUF4436)